MAMLVITRGYSIYSECIECGLKFVLTVRRSVLSYLPNSWAWLWTLKASLFLCGKTKDNGLSCLTNLSIWKHAYHLIQYQMLSNNYIYISFLIYIIDLYIIYALFIHYLYIIFIYISFICRLYIIYVLFIYYLYDYYIIYRLLYI
jgi:hypothetical protein